MNKKFFTYNKYRNKSTICGRGHKHDSRGEASYCDQLALLEKSGDVKSYRTQVMYYLLVNGIKITGHRVDFEVVNKLGELEIHEYKGYATSEWNLKRKLFEAIYPDIKYIVVHG